MKIAVAVNGGQVAVSFREARTFEIYEIENGAKGAKTVLDYEGVSFDATSLAQTFKRLDVTGLMVGTMDKASRLPFMMFQIAILAGCTGPAADALDEYLLNPHGGCAHSGACADCENEASCEHAAG